MSKISKKKSNNCVTYIETVKAVIADGRTFIQKHKPHARVGLSDATAYIEKTLAFKNAAAAQIQTLGGTDEACAAWLKEPEHKKQHQTLVDEFNAFALEVANFVTEYTKLHAPVSQPSTEPAPRTLAEIIRFGTQQIEACRALLKTYKQLEASGTYTMNDLNTLSSKFKDIQDKAERYYYNQLSQEQRNASYQQIWKPFYALAQEIVDLSKKLYQKNAQASKKQ